MTRFETCRQIDTPTIKVDHISDKMQIDMAIPASERACLEVDDNVVLVPTV